MYDVKNTFYEATTDVIWDWDLETGEISRNPKGVQNVYGFEDNALINTLDKWVRQIHPGDIDYVISTIIDTHHATHQNSFSIEYRFLRPDGIYIHVYDRGFVVRNGSGNPVRMIGTAQNISGIKSLEIQLTEERLKQQKIIAEAIIEAQEKERTRIGNELHDNVNQILTTAKLYAGMIKSLHQDHVIVSEKITDLLSTAIKEIRDLSYELVTPQLKENWLFTSIQGLLNHLHLINLFAIDFTHDDHQKFESLSHCQRVTIFRIIQEQVKNIITYSHARHVSIDLSVKQHLVHLHIQDDGIGFDYRNSRKGIGLFNIEERTKLYQGSMNLRTAPGKGCSLLIIMPMN